MSKKNKEGDDGALFSRVYLRPATAQRDSARFRIRLQSRFDEFMSKYSQHTFADVIEGELGVPIERYEYPNFHAFFREAELRDVLDTITLAYRFLVGDGQATRAQSWRDLVSRVFHEEGLGYVVNDRGAVRYLVDEEFERARFSVIDGLGAGRFNAVRTAVDEAFKKLDREPFDTKAAVRSMFEAVETLCKVLGDHNDDLDEGMVKKRIKPMVARIYGAEDASAQSFGEQTVEAFIKWVNAGHRYRHGPKTEEPHDPPLELTVSFLSQGAAHIRFLIDVDRKKG